MSEPTFTHPNDALSDHIRQLTEAQARIQELEGWRDTAIASLDRAEDWKRDALARIQELEAERDRARDFAIGVLNGAIDGASHERGTMTMGPRDEPRFYPEELCETLAPDERSPNL